MGVLPEVKGWHVAEEMEDEGSSFLRPRKEGYGWSKVRCRWCDKTPATDDCLTKEFGLRCQQEKRRRALFLSSLECGDPSPLWILFGFLRTMAPAIDMGSSIQKQSKAAKNRRTPK
jgi:hypothetical protein